MGRRKAIKNMQLHEIIETMEKEYMQWDAENAPIPCWDFEEEVLVDDMGAVKELKELFEVLQLAKVPKIKYLLDEIYSDRLEQLAERRKFAKFAKRLMELSSDSKYVVVSPSGLKYIHRG